MSEELRARIEARLGDLTPVGRRVALVLLDEHDRLGFHSATDLARMAGTSDATVIRTVQRLGYRGMIDLKAEIARNLAPPTLQQRLGPATPDSHADDAVTAAYETQLRALTRLHQPELRIQIVEAGSRIGGARRVHVNARGVSVGIADYAVALLGRVGVDARRLGSAAGIVADDLIAIEGGDLVVVISSGSRNRWHETLYERCSALGVGVVLITDAQPSPTVDSVVVRAGRGDPTGTASHVSTVATIEAIVLTHAALQHERAETTLAQLTDLRELLTR